MPACRAARSRPRTASFQRAQSAWGQANYVLASDWFDDSLGFAADTITFDIELFESNVIDEMSGEAVGWALSITFDGQTYNGGHAEGEARTAADAAGDGTVAEQGHARCEREQDL